MKKNKVMRIASVLLIVTLLSTCAISGTFAKYVTTGEADGEARVAKWGIEISVDGDIASAEYLKNDDNNDPDYNPNNASGAAADITVQSADGAWVVAPGTDSGDGLTASITGRPEVATRFSLALPEGSYEEVVLPAGTYPDYTTADPDDTFTITKDYRPVKLTLTFTRTGTSSGNFTVTGSVADIVAKLDDFGHGNGDLNADFRPNSNVNAEFNLTWEWPYQGARDGFTATEIDQMDTYLGNAIAGIIPNLPDTVKTVEKFDVTASATQID